MPGSDGPSEVRFAVTFAAGRVGLGCWAQQPSLCQEQGQGQGRSVVQKMRRSTQSISDF